MKRLDKFSILIESEEMGKEVKRIADKAGLDFCRHSNKECFTLKGNIFTHVNYYYRFYKDYFVIGGYSTQGDEYPIITLSEFKQMFEPEIIGYECPMDLYGGAILKGDILVPVLCKDWYVCKIRSNGYSVPKEIVETWKPIYKESSKTVIVGGKEWEVEKHGIYRITSCSSTAGIHFEEIEEAYNDLRKLFGESATLLEIKNLVEVYKSLNKEGGSNG